MLPIPIPLCSTRPPIDRLIMIREPWLFGNVTAPHNVEEEGAAEDCTDTERDELSSYVCQQSAPNHGRALMEIDVLDPP